MSFHGNNIENVNINFQKSSPDSNDLKKWSFYSVWIYSVWIYLQKIIKNEKKPWKKIFHFIFKEIKNNKILKDSFSFNY